MDRDRSPSLGVFTTKAQRHKGRPEGSPRNTRNTRKERDPGSYATRASRLQSCAACGGHGPPALEELRRGYVGVTGRDEALAKSGGPPSNFSFQRFSLQFFSSAPPLCHCVFVVKSVCDPRRVHHETRERHERGGTRYFTTESAKNAEVGI